MAKILVVEDEPLIRESAAMAIRDWGHETFEASDVDEALTLLLSPQQIDILFTDVYLKTEIHGGCLLARRALELQPNLRVLYTTGNFISPAMKALFVKDTQCLRKPYTEEQLQDSLKGLVAV